MNALKHSGQHLHLVGGETFKRLRVAVLQGRASWLQPVQCIRRQ